MDYNREGMVSRVVRVGAVFPGRIALNWPLVGLQYDADSFELTAPAPVRRLVVRALGSRIGGRAGGAKIVACRWDDVLSIRRIKMGAEVRLASGDRFRVFPLASWRTERFLDGARAGGTIVV